jgi:hypothetical protein
MTKPLMSGDMVAKNGVVGDSFTPAVITAPSGLDAWTEGDAIDGGLALKSSLRAVE